MMVDEQTESVDWIPENLRRDTLEESARALLHSYKEAETKIREQGTQLNALCSEFEEMPKKFRRETLAESVRVMAASDEAACNKIRELVATNNSLDAEAGELRGRVAELEVEVASLRARPQPKDLRVPIPTTEEQAALLVAAANRTRKVNR